MNYKLAINMAMTIDGKVVRPDGKWYGLSSRKDKARMDKYRSESEALILGKNSIINDNPIINLRYEKGENPVPVILIRKGSIPSDKRVFKTGKRPIIFCTDLNFNEVNESLAGICDIFSSGKENTNPEKIIQILISKGYRSFLLEGGPTLNYSFFEKNLVNRIYLTIVPFLIGKSNLVGIINGEYPFPDFDLNKWKLISNETVENEIFLCYDKI